MQRRNHPLAILEGAAGYLLPGALPTPKKWEHMGPHMVPHVINHDKTISRKRLS